MTEQEITSFCDHLKESMLRYARAGDPVDVTASTTCVPVGGGDGGSPTDYRLTGGTFTILLGEPAKVPEGRHTAVAPELVLPHRGAARL